MRIYRSELIPSTFLSPVRFCLLVQHNMRRTHNNKSVSGGRNGVVVRRRLSQAAIQTITAFTFSLVEGVQYGWNGLDRGRTCNIIYTRFTCKRIWCFSSDLGSFYIFHHHRCVVAAAASCSSSAGYISVQIFWTLINNPLLSRGFWRRRSVIIIKYTFYSVETQEVLPLPTKPHKRPTATIVVLCIIILHGQLAL